MNPYVRIKQPASFYLCGWKGMIDEARKRIQDMGYDRRSIHLEIIWLVHIVFSHNGQLRI
jgi:hypothetical protein